MTRGAVPLPEAVNAPAPGDIVRSVAEAGSADRSPLIVLEPLQRLLDELGIGSGPLDARFLGDGHSNVTCLLAREGGQVVLRRPPRPPYAPSAHDVLREARLLRLLEEAGAPVPAIIATIEEPEVLGVPFVLMEYVPGHIISAELPPALADPADCRRIGEQLVDTLALIHGLEIVGSPLAAVGPPTGYLERQLRRFKAIWAEVATRAIPDVEAVGQWLAQTCPDSAAATVVHGDYRLGNVVFGEDRPSRLVAVLDWEMATLGDPLADLGYLCATWAEPSDGETPIHALSRATRSPGFLSRADLSARYAARTGRDVGNLLWYEVLALWKAAIFLEASYRRYRLGAATDPFFASLEDGVPRLIADALARVRSAPGS